MSFVKVAMVLACAVLSIASCANAAATPPPPPTASEFRAMFEELKAEMHLISEKDATRRILELQRMLPPPPHQDKIDHFVVLLMENHSAAHYFGCMDLPGFDGIPKEGHKLPKDPSDPSKGYVTVRCGADAKYVCDKGPGYNLFSGKFKPGANSHAYPYDHQSDSYSALNGATENATATVMFTPDRIPIKATLAREYAVFNKLYTAVPSASTPNHLMIQSATSCGIVDNIVYSKCGGKTATFPQMTIYDSLAVNNVSFALYMNSTCGLPGDDNDCHGVDPNTPDAGSTINAPDVGMSGVGRWKAHFKSMTRFYEAAAGGDLPALSWLLPPIQACDHPCHDIAKGERLLKDIYEALRASPKWEKTLLFVVYDDAGGYYDPVVPPFEGIPPDDAPCHVLEQCPGHNKFDFRRLGIRTSGLLISPWVAKGTVIQEPKGPMNTSQFDLTSVPATVRNLFNLTGALTHRDAWSGSFDELLLNQPRTDTPLHLPDAPAPAKPWTPPPKMGGDGGDDLEVAAGARPEPQHCSRAGQVCHGPDALTEKHRKNVHLFSHLTDVPEPDMAAMSATEADAWLKERWIEFMQHDEL